MCWSDAAILTHRIELWTAFIMRTIQRLAGQWVARIVGVTQAITQRVAFMVGSDQNLIHDPVGGTTEGRTPPEKESLQ